MNAAITPPEAKQMHGDPDVDDFEGDDAELDDLEIDMAAVAAERAVYTRQHALEASIDIAKATGDFETAAIVARATAFASFLSGDDAKPN